MMMMKYAPPDEQAIATKLVDTILQAGHLISVIDGEVATVKLSTDRTEILDALCTTDHDVLVIRDAHHRRVGSVTLIWGNGCGLISDNTVDPEGVMATLLAPAEALAETYAV